VLFQYLYGASIIVLHYDPTNAQLFHKLFTLLHFSTLSCHPQGACNQYLAKLHKYFKCSCW